MSINVKRDKFAHQGLPYTQEELKANPDLLQTGKSPIIIKDKYDVSESDIGYSIPIVDKDGAIINWRVRTEEEYNYWVDMQQATELNALKARRPGWRIGSVLTKFINYFK